MTLSTAQMVRLRIQDIPTVFDGTLYGDGTADTFTFYQRNQTSATAFVPLNGNAWTATAGAAFDPTIGSMQFSGVISAFSAFRVRYIYSVFSDDEINTMITAGGGDVIGASIEAVQNLLFDAPKRSRWAAPDGSQFDDTSSQNALAVLYKVLVDRQEQQAASEGGISEWGLSQSSY